MRRLLAALLAAAAVGSVLAAFFSFVLPYFVEQMAQGTVDSLSPAAAPSSGFIDQETVGQLWPWVFFAGAFSTFAARMSPRPARRRR